MKICSECKWYVPTAVKNPSPEQESEYGRCERPTEVSLVTGKLGVHPLKYCYIIRSTSIYKGEPICGPDGIWWEAR